MTLERAVEADDLVEVFEEDARSGVAEAGAILMDLDQIEAVVPPLTAVVIYCFKAPETARRASA